MQALRQNASQMPLAFQPRLCNNRRVSDVIICVLLAKYINDFSFACIPLSILGGGLYLYPGCDQYTGTLPRTCTKDT